MGGAEHNLIIMKSERGAAAGGWMAVGLRGLQLEHQEPRDSKIILQNRWEDSVFAFLCSYHVGVYNTVNTNQKNQKTKRTVYA